MAVCQLKIYWLIYCYRGQAPSHIFDRVYSSERSTLEVTRHDFVYSTALA